MTTSPQPDDRRLVTLHRREGGGFEATNSRGGTIKMYGADDEFSPVELLLAAIAGCSAIDVDIFTARRAEPTEFVVESRGRKVRDDEGRNLMSDLELQFHVRFPEGEDGDKARAILTKSITDSRDRLCTVSRTVQEGVPVTYLEDDTTL